MVLVSDLVDVLTRAKDEYYNNGESFLSDAEYDALEKELEKLDPTHPLIIGVGSEVRRDKVKIPFQMGSLDQIHENEAESWIKNDKLKDESIVVTSKEDGVSVLLVYGEDGYLQIAFSRGDGTYGQDVTRTVKRINRVPKKVSERMVIRAEIIMTDETFEQLNTGKKNPRNYVAGQMNKEIADQAFCDNVDVIAYELISFG